jgi:hypothetical protein
MDLGPRIEFLEMSTGRYSSVPTFFQNLTRTKYAGLNFGWRPKRLALVAATAARFRGGGGRGGGDHGGEGRGGGGLRGGGVAAAGSAGAEAEATAAGVVQTVQKYPGLNLQ